VHTPEPPQDPGAKPNLLSPTRCTSDAQQLILARLERKAAARAEMVRIARRSLRVAGYTTAALALAVSLALFLRHETALAPPVVALATPPGAPASAAILLEAGERLADSSLPAMPPIQLDAAPEPVMERVIIGRPKPAVARKVKVERVKVAKVQAAKLQRAIALRAAGKVSQRRTELAKKMKPVVPPRTELAQVDTDANLLRALLLHASRPAVVPPAPRRPPCLKVAALCPPLDSPVAAGQD